MEARIINEAIETLTQYKEQGRKIVGVVQHGIFPDELVLAAGASPLKFILGGKDEQELGDQYLSATTCPYGRATLGFFHQGHPLYSLVDSVIVGTFCNGAQNVGNYLETFGIPSMPMFIPHDRSPSAIRFYISEMRKIKDYLERLTGNPISRDALSETIKQYNDLRKQLRVINDHRKKELSPVRGTTIHELVSYASLVGPEKGLIECKTLIKAIGNASKYTGSRVFLTGSGITLGDSLLQLIEQECGGLIVADDLWSSMDYFLEDVSLNDSDLFSALADRYLCRNLCGRMAGEKEIRIPRILELYRTFKASGIINHTLKFCDSYSNLKPEFKRIMNRQQIQVLDIDRDFAESNVGQVQTRIEAFLEMLA